MKTTNKMHFYESIAHDFDSVVNMYDTKKRISVIFDELLPANIKGKKLLDAGCGTGWTSLEATKRGAVVTSLDVGPELLAEVKKKCATTRVVGSVLELPFPDNTFDIVVSTEVIEHVTVPQKAIKEMYRVLKPGGTLALTTPNRFWHWSVVVANYFHWRPYQGLENWLSFYQLTRWSQLSGFHVKKVRGIHALPFNFSLLHPVIDFLDGFHPLLDRYMINQSISAEK